MTVSSSSPTEAAPQRWTWAFADALEVGDTYAPAGYDLRDPSAWCAVSDVEVRDGEVHVWHDEETDDSDPLEAPEDDGEEGDAVFDSAAVVYIAWNLS